MCIRMRKLLAECKILAIDAKLCSHLMFQNSFRNIDRQNNYRNVWDDRLELWPSIIKKHAVYESCQL